MSDRGAGPPGLSPTRLPTFGSMPEVLLHMLSFLYSQLGFMRGIANMKLASSGQTVFTRRDAMEALGLSHGAFLDAAARLTERGHILAPRRGFYVITPTRFLKWGAPPPNWYVDAMMEDAGRPYYVAVLKAAELHGAAHQAGQHPVPTEAVSWTFTVVSLRQLTSGTRARTSLPTGPVQSWAI